MLTKINNELSAREFLSQAKFYESYSRFSDETGRYETWDEAVDRVMNMHKVKYSSLSDNPEFNSIIEKITKAYKEKKILGAQRALQFGGEQILKHELKLYNCFDVATRFITDKGIFSFKDFNKGDIINVLTHKGNWKKAIVKNYGKQKLNNITFKKNGSVLKTIKATSNHRWILANGDVTDSIKIGDRLYKQPNIFGYFDWDNAPQEEKLYWCYGMVYGDGTVQKSGHSHIRLCGNDAQYKYRFEEMSFKTSSSMSIGGDFYVFTGTYQKTLPNPNIDSPELIRAFVRGYMDADGTKNNNKHGQIFNGIQSSNKDSFDWIRTCFPIAGVNIVSEKDLTGEQTNYGIRPNTIFFRTSDSSGSKFNAGWKVEKIEEDIIEDVWCLEVEDDHSFILEGGIATGNCVAGYADRPAFFNEFFYILLCGCGDGYSIQKHHINKIPKIKSRTRYVRTHVIKDSIEGWADALGALMSSFFEGGGVFPQYEGKCVYFDSSNVRPKGDKISGGFLAPGPEPLVTALYKIEAIMNERASIGFLRPIDVFDIACHAADAVISGGVRRAATICLFSPDDTEMLNAKTGNWHQENPQRARANISMVVKRDEIELETFLSYISSIKQFGEPGFVFVDDLEQVFNPCVTEDTIIDTSEGPRLVKNLINKKFTAIVNGEHHVSEKGFWSTGVKDVFKVTTNRGYEINATENHKVLIERNDEKVWVEIKDLIIGDQFVLNNNIQKNIEIDQAEFKKGWLIGEILGDGCHNPKKYSSFVKFWGETANYMSKKALEYFHETCKRDTNHKVGVRKYKDIRSVHSTLLSELAKEYLTPGSKNIIFEENWNNSLMAGFLSGWFDADGSVLYSGKKQCASLRLCSVNLNNLRIAQVFLSHLGIVSTIYKDRNKNRKNPIIYGNKPLHELHIGRECINRFHEIIGFQDPNKSKKLQEILDNRIRPPYKDKFISTVTSIDKISTEEVFDCTVENVHCFSANGLIVHNCVEISLYPVYEGQTGWQACNLTEGNGAKIKSVEDFYEICEISAMLGTLQAGYTNFKYVGEITRKIVEREALLGVSITGWMNSPDILLDPKTLKKGAQIVKDVNKKVAKLIGINPAARTTCVKPSGNASTVLGTAPATQGEHSKRYLRLSQMNKENPISKAMVKENPYMVEESIWSEGNRDYVIMWPIIAPKKSKFKSELHGVKFLEIVKMIQDNWVNEGTDIDLCVNKNSRHNVSNTVLVKENEWQEVARYVYDNRKYFAGISFIGESGDKDYVQAPYTSVETSDNLVKKYGDASLFASGLIVDSQKGFTNLWQACSTAIYNGVPEGEMKDNQKDWIRRFHKFAENHFEGDRKKAEYCLKDVALLHKWNKIQQNIKYIDFNEYFDRKIEVDIDTTGAMACSPTEGCEL